MSPPGTRMAVIVRGIVQGVGFRPFVYQLAQRLGLTGFVRNESSCVRIEVQGSTDRIEEFCRCLLAEAPPQAKIEAFEVMSIPRVAEEGCFEIRASNRPLKHAPVIPADLAICADCLAEITNPKERRYRYPFTNCTNCGPRWSLIRALPYDRPNTSMAGFPLCAACRKEYEDPQDRRFHAQPIACPDCGPSVALLAGTGVPLAAGEEALNRAAQAVRQGRILALLGLGGFQLIVDATSPEAVDELRQRKARPHKPFALMFPSLDSIRAYGVLSSVEETWLKAPQAPILLVRRRSQPLAGHPPIATQVAPGNPYLGCMLPYSPLHYLLIQEIGRPVVCTSGNLSEEPMAFTVEDGLHRLGRIADVFLVHNRPIVRPVDDSVARVFRNRLQLLRRARGFSPLPIKVASSGASLLAVGAHQKNTVGLLFDSVAVLSSHIGDLDNSLSLAVYERAINDLLQFYGVKVVGIACDLHPDYASTHYARKLAKEWEIPLLPVQHHHAHIAACMAEHGLEGPVLGIAWDGAGYGADGTLWGGEFLLCQLSSFRRVATFRAFPLPGGEKAVRQPRRSALGLAFRSQLSAGFDRCGMLFEPGEFAIVLKMLERGLNCPWTSSVGRLFDAVAALVGLSAQVSFEGQAAMELESAASGSTSARYRFVLQDGDPLVLDWEPVIQGILADLIGKIPRGVIAWAFHEALAEAACEVACRVGVGTVVIAGGCFQNNVLSQLLVDKLEGQGFRVFWPEAFPPNDGGIALGQLAVAASLMKKGPVKVLPHTA